MFLPKVKKNKSGSEKKKIFTKIYEKMDDRFILKSTKEEYFTICEYWSSDLKTIHAEKNDNTKNITVQ